MKKTVKILIFLCLIFACLSLKVSAEGEGGEYSISYDGESYVLYNSDVEMRCGSLGECLGKINSPKSIRFVDITSEEAIVLPKGEYKLSGELYSNRAILVPSGANVVMVDMSLTLNSESYIRIKGGALTVDSSSIRGGGKIILLDYSSASSLEIISGSIYGDEDCPLIDIENGRAIIRGADIENKGGAAIRSDSELCLSGSPKISGATYGIILECPMYLSAHGEEYFSTSPLSIQYTDIFPEGTLTEIFYESGERSLANISLYDRDGKEAEITYFSTSKYTDEENFGGVYLPHTVKFFVWEKLVCEEKLLSGERVTLPIADSIVGYEFDNWYRDREGEIAYSSEKRVYSSFSLYGVYLLDAPTFTISSLDFTYDGKERYLSFDALSHPVEGGYYTYTWYKDGEEISSLSRVAIKNVADSGTYSCKVTYNLDGNSASVYAENIKINIKKQPVAVPSIPASKYTGLSQYPTVAPSDLYSVSVISGCDVGSYPVAFTLVDDDNYSWIGFDGDSVLVSFEITKADNTWISQPSASDSYIGFPLKITATSLFGNVEFIYSATENGTYTSDVPLSAGNYYVKAVVSESSNYSALISSPVSFSILEEKVIGLELACLPSKTEYFAFDKFDMSGMKVYAVYDSGRREVLSESCLRCVYHNGDTLRAGDASVVIEYLNAGLQIPVSVNALDYDLSEIDFSSQSIIYDGSYHTYSINAGNVIGFDGIPLSYEIIGGGRDVGEYTVSIIFSSDSRDYNLPDKVYTNLVISPLEVDLIWSDTEFVYDSTPKIPNAYFIDVMGVKREVTVCGSAILAADSYSASAVDYSKNYIFSNPECAFSISKADYDMSDILWSSSSLIYNGALHEVTLSNLPAGVSVVGYTDNRATNVGKYVATASLKYDERNYNVPIVPSYEWEIKPAQYDMSLLEFVSMEYEYDGDEHFPAIRGTVPIGADEIAISYSFSRGAVNVSDGEVVVTISFSTESCNYLTPPDVTAKVKIIPKGIYVAWSDVNFVYDGNIKLPLANAQESEIKVRGGNVNAGSYIATAESLNPNYTVLNSTIQYVIEKAENYWIVEPDIDDFYESGSPHPSASPYFGIAEFRYYSDDTAKTEVFIDAPGQYFMSAIVPESENYRALIFAPISFNCIEVVANGIRTEITEDLIAFSSADKSLKVYLLYNDGSESLLPEGTVVIKYQNGDSLRCADKQIEISYSNFTEAIPIEVLPASYDTSSVHWEGGEVEYDGKPHAPYIRGLPEGISLVGYVGEAGITAGEYIFSAIISYDEENYLHPEISDCTLIIKKALVNIPSDIEIIYSGSVVNLPTSELYTSTADVKIKNSGEYTVNYILIDAENYVFGNGDTKCQSAVTVLPRELKITISDFKLYWLETDISPTYTIDGEIVYGDVVDITYYLEGEKIYARTDNQNYTLIVESGNLERIPYPSEEMRGKLMVYALLLMVFILLVIFIIKNRENINDIVCMIQAKRKHRVGIGYIDNAPITNAIDTPSPLVARSDKSINSLKSPNQIPSVIDIAVSPITINISADLAGDHHSIVSHQRCAISENSEVLKDSKSPDIISLDVGAKEDISLIDEKSSSIPESFSDDQSFDDACDISKEDLEYNFQYDNTNMRETLQAPYSFESDNKADCVEEHLDDVDEIILSLKDATLNDISDSHNEKAVEIQYDITPLDSASESTDKDELDYGGEDGIEENLDGSSFFKSEEPSIEIKMEYANAVITNALAKKLIKEEREAVYTGDKIKSIVNVDTLSRSFNADDRVDVNILKKKSLVPYDTNYIKVLARGAIDKPLHVFANEFSLAAVKMILLSGGEAIRIISEKEKSKTKK